MTGVRLFCAIYQPQQSMQKCWAKTILLRQIHEHKDEILEFGNVLQSSHSRLDTKPVCTACLLLKQEPEVQFRFKKRGCKT